MVKSTDKSMELRADGNAKILGSSMKILGLAFLSGASLLPYGAVNVAHAQQRYSSIQAFGDSYADTGNLWKYLPPGSQYPAYPTGRFSGGTNYVDTLSALLAAGQTNYAIGGATTDGTNVVDYRMGSIPGFKQQWRNIISSGVVFSPSDVVTVNIGGNDARWYYQTGGTVANAGTAATTAAGDAMAGISALARAGARNIVFTTGDVSLLPEALLPSNASNAAAGSAFSTAYNMQMMNGLAGLAAAGVRVEYINVPLIGARIQANPALYGLSSSGACPLTCIGNPGLQSQYLYYSDGVHLTSAGFAIVAKYIQNRLDAPYTFAAQGDMAMTAAQGLFSTMAGRLNLFNAATPAPSRVAGSPLDGDGRLSIYMNADGGFGSRSPNRASNGYEWDSVGGVIGAEYRTSQWVAGLAFNYVNPTTNMYNGAGSSNMDAYQFGFYGSYTGTNVFLQLMGSYGLLYSRNTRPGVVDSIYSQNTGNNYGVDGRIGYLFDVAEGVKLGPTVGISYVGHHVDAYNETGDQALTLHVNGQDAYAITGSAGLQGRYDFAWNSHQIKSYVNLTAEDPFQGDTRLIRYAATSAPIIVNNWAIPTGANYPFGRVSFGVSGDLMDGFALNVVLSQTFARKGGDNFFGSGGFKLTF